MSDLTREELRIVSEAVGGQWVETETQCWAEFGDPDNPDCLFVVMIGEDGQEDQVFCHDCEGISLLRAWKDGGAGREVEIYFNEGESVDVDLLDHVGEGSWECRGMVSEGLCGPAVRAVLSWWEDRGRK